MNQNNVENGMAGFSLVFFIITIIAKLTGLIDLHWFFVLTSLWWGPIIAVFTATVLYFLVFGIAFFFAFFFKRREDDKRR